MLKHLGVMLGLCVFGAISASAQIQKFCIPGVAPSRNVTSLELSPSTSIIDDKGGISSSALTTKMYYAFTPDYNIGIEVPLSRYEVPGDSVNGLGDILLAAEAIHSVHYIDWGLKLETTLPTATDQALGTGKWVLMPSVFALVPVNENFFISFGYKQYSSIAGDGGRKSVNYARVRALISYMADAQWWVTFDPQYYMDYDRSGQAELVWESEIGVMVNPGTAMYIKPGAHLGGNWKTRDWTLSMGFKILYL